MSGIELSGILMLVLAVTHSALGEVRILRPVLSNQQWSIGIPRSITDPLLRMVWHLVSITWFGLALLAFGVSIPMVIAWSMLIPAAVLIIGLRGHLAWPLFLMAGLAALRHDGWFDDVAGPAAWATGLVFGLAGLAHLYWAMGGARGSAAVFPELEGREGWRPGRGLTAVVAFVLLAFGAVVVLFGTGASASLRPSVIVGAAVLLLRAAGEGRYVGFSKRVFGTDFSRLDTALYTPLVVLLAFGTLASLL